ncbi:MAG TPA: cytochrome b N-terminal domain-containing protein [Bryobacteraceae bacterium]|nr:cytochrome b N-terminal domain-containing protein [Bryobacteraceae bacterium]
MLRAIPKFIDERTGLISAIRHFLDEDIPASAGWHQVLGSVALFAFLLQIFTGFLLALNYAPTPGEAWDSLRYIVTQVAAGSIIRAMHHWGASLMIIVVVLHMAQTFLWGAYKKPREATWIAGVLLLLLTLAFGLSGYLLTWDNRAYWGTIVTTRIMGLAPGGSVLLRMLGAEGGGIGRVAFARFYAAHVTLLPLLTLGLIVLHVYLVRKHGVTPAPGDELLAKKKFFPEQVFRDTVAIFVWCVALGFMVALVKVPLGRIADPTDTSYVPRPEWYFLFLFQFLKFFQGPLEVFGAVVLPGIAVAALALMPFIDRSAVVKIQRRFAAISVACVAALGWTALTATAVATTPRQPDEDGTVEAAAWQRIPASQLAGIGVFRRENCSNCHTPGRSQPAPDLTAIVVDKDANWMKNHFKTLSDMEIGALVQLLTKRTDDTTEACLKAPDEAVRGAMIYHANQCSSCHTLNGEGGDVGPVLNGLRLRHDREWVKAHFSAPDRFTPGSEMPAFNFNPDDLERITNYVMSIPKL